MAKSIIIAGGSSGFGHIQAAENIKNSIVKIGYSSEIEMINIFDFLSFYMRFLLENIWEFSSKYMKSIYRLSHSTIINNNCFSELLKKHFVKVANRVEHFLNEKEISAFIATHPVAAAVGAVLKRKYNFLLCVAPTDFIVHNFYFYPEVDFYYVPPECKVLRSIPYAENLHTKFITTGIPISPDFWIEKERTGILKELGFSQDLFTILISFGATGLNGDKHINMFKTLINESHPMQFIIISGKNQLFHNKLQSIRSKYSDAHKTKIFQFVNNIADIMAAADVFIGKAGGLSLSEALAEELPIGILESLPGQEDYNVDYIIRNNAGIYIENLSELTGWISDLASQNILMEWKKRARMLGRPLSSQKIATHILNSI